MWQCDSGLAIGHTNSPGHTPLAIILLPQDCYGSGIELLRVAAMAGSNRSVDRSAIKCPLASHNGFFRLNRLLNVEILQRASKVVHNRFLSTNKSAIPVDDNDVIRHKTAKLFNFSGTNGRRPSNCNASDVLSFVIGRGGRHTTPEKSRWLAGSIGLLEAARGWPETRILAVCRSAEARQQQK
jgi:hypothetical protein